MCGPCLISGHSLGVTLLISGRSLRVTLLSRPEDTQASQGKVHVVKS